MYALVRKGGLARTVTPLFAVHVCMELARPQTHAHAKVDTLVMIAVPLLIHANLALNAHTAHVTGNSGAHIAVDLYLIIVVVGGGINILLLTPQIA